MDTVVTPKKEQNQLILVKDLTRVFPVPGGEFTALKKINLEIPEGTFVILKGRSGSGKTTLMNLIGTLDDPTEGSIWLDGREIGRMSERERENLRRKELGFVFQSVSLIPSLSVIQNVEFSLRLAGEKDQKVLRSRAEECIKHVGLGNRMEHMPAELSGGEQQRVAIAKAMAHRPRLLLADEPTAELDSAMAAAVTELFKKMSAEEGVTVLMTTHDAGLMGAADML
ncbi:MAG: ABC transporter ATP-binding protein, partial [Lachnospiraceae bacterium]|nr:ABC transporter ATP-binding protein [Lachnospiraceae bacterium]